VDKFLIHAVCIIGMVITTLMADQSMRPIFDYDGKETGSYNVNPDPDGEPWVITPMKITPEVQKRLDSIPEWKPRKALSKSAASTLPRSVNHVKEPEFRPIFTQKGGSCSAASGIGYIYTWEVNILSGASGDSNRCMYMFPYNFLNNGNMENGIWWYDAWDILKYTGCVREADWPSPLGRENGTEWANTYEAYHNANFDRCSTYYKISKPGTPENLIKVKQWIYDHGRGDPKGGCVQLNAGIDFKEKTIPQGSPEAGSKIATVYDGPNTIHAMILAGYNDDVYLEPDKKGAFLLVNSYGKSFGTNGTMWIPYDKFASETEVYLLEVVRHIPRLEFKIELQNYDKTRGRFTSGFSSDLAASTPKDTQSYGNAFRGNTGSFTGEIGIDCTKFWNAFSNNNLSGKFFLKSRGSGVIKSLSLMMYDSTGRNLIKEIKCPQTETAVGTTMSITIEDAVAIHHISKYTPQSFALRKQSAGDYMLFIPFDNVSKVSIKNLQGRLEAKCTHQDGSWYRLPQHVSPGMKIVTAEAKGVLHNAKIIVH